MSKVFTWVFGAITGLLTGLVLVASCMVTNPKNFMELAKIFNEE